MGSEWHISSGIAHSMGGWHLSWAGGQQTARDRLTLVLTWLMARKGGGIYRRGSSLNHGLLQNFFNVIHLLSPLVLFEKTHKSMEPNNFCFASGIPHIEKNPRISHWCGKVFACKAEWLGGSHHKDSNDPDNSRMTDSSRPPGFTFWPQSTTFSCHFLRILLLDFG